jgi:hypothetical protein
MRHAIRGGVFSAATAVALLVLSACGGSADADGDTARGGESESESPDAQALEFAGCMRDNGVDMPDPGPGQEGLADALQAVAGDFAGTALEEAVSACQDLLPQYASEAHGDDDEVMLDLAECLREQGLDVSDNPFDDAHAGDIDQDEFRAAMEECRGVMAGGGS